MKSIIHLKINCLCLLLVVSSNVVISEILDFRINPPESLKAGDAYRIMFISQSSISGSSSSISNYNDFAEKEARKNPILAGLQTEWFAALSTSSVHAFDNTMTDPNNENHLDVPIFRVDGSTMIASGNEALWSGLDQSVLLDQFGNQKTAFTWTGSFLSGHRRNAFSSEGNDNVLGASFPTGGVPHQIGRSWIDVGVGGSNDLNPIYVISDVLQAPSPLTLSIEKSVTIRFATQPGKSYFIEGTTDLAEWFVVEEGIQGDGENRVFYFPITHPETYYRLRLE